MRLGKFLLTVVMVVLLSACGGGGSSSNSSDDGINNPPTVNAGEDKSVKVNETITITGVANDSDGAIIAYEWKEGNKLLATTASFEYLPTVVGTHTLTLTVTDDEGVTASDSLVVTVSNDVEYIKFEDDFEENSISNQWKLSIPDGYYQNTITWNLVQDNTQSFEGKGGVQWGGGTSIQYVSNFQENNLTILCEVKVTEVRNGGHHSGIIFGYVNKNTYYTYHITNNAQSIAIYSINLDEDEKYHLIGIYDLNISLFGRWQKLKLKIEDNHFLGYLNDQLVIDVYDNNYLGGYVGIENSGAVTRFDNFKLY